MADYTFPNLPDSYEPGDRIIFNFTGGVQEFPLRLIGSMKIECYGARGGNTPGGAGGYTYGVLDCLKYKNVLNDKLYVFVGESPGWRVPGFGGGAAADGYGGGGASDVRTYYNGNYLEYASLIRRIVVGAGGGGHDPRGGNQGPGGPGGGWVGGNGRRCSGGTQTEGGRSWDGSGLPGQFGYGGEDWDWAGGGGGGWYGGGGGDGGAGGSSYAAGNPNCPFANPDGIVLDNSGTIAGMNSAGHGYVIFTIMTLAYKLYNKKHLTVRYSDNKTRKIPLYEKTEALKEPLFPVRDTDSNTIVYARLGPTTDSRATPLRVRRKLNGVLDVFAALSSSTVEDDGTPVYHPGNQIFAAPGMYKWMIPASKVKATIIGGGGASGKNVFSLDPDGRLIYHTGGSGGSGQIRKDVEFTNLPAGKVVDVYVGGPGEGSYFSIYLSVNGGENGTDATDTTTGKGGAGDNPGKDGVSGISEKGNTSQNGTTTGGGASKNCTTANAEIIGDLTNATINNCTITNAIFVGDTLSSGKITVGSVPTTQISNFTIVSGDINNTESVGGVTTGANAKNIPTGNIYTDARVEGGIVTGGKIKTGKISVGTLSSGTVKSGTIEAGKFTGGTVSGSTITGCTLTVATIKDIDLINCSINNMTISNPTIVNGLVTGGTIKSGTLDDRNSGMYEQYGTIEGGEGLVNNYGGGADIIVGPTPGGDLGSNGMILLSW